MTSQFFKVGRGIGKKNEDELMMHSSKKVVTWGREGQKGRKNK